MANPFVWYELMTPDRDGAARFYADVIGWTVEEVADVGMPYTLLKTGERQQAGVMTTPAEAGAMNSMWFGYIGVDDVDAAAAKAGAAGARLHKGPGDIPNVGRFAVMADPQGAMFMLFRADRDPLPEQPYMAHGSIGWHELHTSDWESAWRFYSGQFGWSQGAQMDMGAMGIYQMYRMARDMDEGAMLNEADFPPAWLFYISVPGIAEAKARIEMHGGTVRLGPIPVPGDRWIVLANDPFGAAFALVGPEKEDAQ